MCLGLYAILVFPRFLCVVICAVAVSLMPPVFYWLQGFICVCVCPGRLLCGL
jgi:hypothetical protein